ncbi:hypothetical protein AB870_22155 [Pandoraea faecigallinarum]|uniref:Uncharacterized protein n=1 Tax=Pandoraea faecigallinarum TaxID=656179 RepID=A0A0H3WX58_9BURK|nr:hypothetical protein [Pandoraea faecigallinarum]AKM32235.1 hypothetical protein AB870_22155 [Pandoraea faecigallinarum]
MLIMPSQIEIRRLTQVPYLYAHLPEPFEPGKPPGTPPPKTPPDEDEPTPEPPPDRPLDPPVEEPPTRPPGKYVALARRGPQV